MPEHVATVREIEEFLWEFFDLWRGNYISGKNDQNKDALNELGIKAKHREEETRNLGVINYVKGPVPDDSGYEGDVWVFGKEVEEQMVYIKLKIYTTKSGVKGCKGMSFHPPKWELKFPYAK